MKTIIISLLLCISITISAQNQENQPSVKSNAIENTSFKNPILPGFHPDPSICRVGDDYYLVTSTFEWFPGIPIYHSKDLVNWNLIAYGLHRPEQINLPEGMPNAKGIYAVTIRHHNALFYLITTCVECGDGPRNFYVTAKSPSGPWSEPVWLEDAPGIDPSLTWDDDGKCYYVGNGRLKEEQDWRGQQGIWLQELDLDQKKLVGEPIQLTYGHANNAVWAEGPHIYKIDGRYLLMHAEGGTSTNHATIVHHSKSILGPYTADQVNPVLTHRHLGDDYPIKSVGHTDIVQTQNGDWWAVMLGKRFMNGHSLLARETFLCPVKFERRKPIFNAGVGKLLAEDKRPDLPWSPFPAKPARDEFDAAELDLEWNMLRTPKTKWHALNDGNLELLLRPYTINELTNPSLLARRIEHHKFSASLKLNMNSKKANEKAGMIIHKNNRHHYQLLKEKDTVVLIKTEMGEETIVARTSYKGKMVILKAEANNFDVQFSYGAAEDDMKPIGESQSMHVMSFTAMDFNGPYIGMYATSTGEASKAKVLFDWFEYKGK